jgi:hypothetical protein
MYRTETSARLREKVQKTRIPQISPSDKTEGNEKKANVFRNRQTGIHLSFLASCEADVSIFHKLNFFLVLVFLGFSLGEVSSSCSPMYRTETSARLCGKCEACWGCAQGRALSG